MPLLLTIIVLIVIRIQLVNENKDEYETFRQDIRTGDQIILGDIQLKFGEVQPPIIRKNEDYFGKKNAIYKLPIEITKNVDGELKKANKFGIYESYGDFQNLALIYFDSSKYKEDLFQSLNSMKKNEKFNIIVETNLVLGEFFEYYKDYRLDRPAFIVIAGPKSEKGIPLYYFKLQNKNER